VPLPETLPELTVRTMSHGFLLMRWRSYWAALLDTLLGMD
jgi:hypothetical protein